VVTTFEYQVHPLTTVLGGSITYPVAQAREVLRRYREVTAAAPDELTAFAGIQPLATGPAFGIAACWSGDLARGERVLAPLRKVGTPSEDTIRPRPYVDMQALLSPPPMRVSSYARSNFLRELSDDLIDVLVARTTAASPGMWFYVVEHLHGRVSRIGADESAFRHRGPGYSVIALSLWLDPVDADASTAWIRGFFGELTPFLTRGVYSNYLGDEGGARVREAYGAAWDRLVALKRAYDPDNVFHLNQNVSPAG
jgi:FAD/FMN-containing dehydrogenase